MDFFFSNNIKGDTIVLDETETNHCIKVFRNSLNDIINIVDGNGNLFIGRISDIVNNQCYVKIEEIKYDYKKRDYYVHIAISPTKNHSRIEWFVEKAIEIGIDEISFLNCERTLRRNVRMSRINKIAKSSIKQSKKANLPKINSIVSYSNFIDCLRGNTYVCHLNNQVQKSLFYYKNKILKKNKTCIMIGPEGDFTNREIESSIMQKTTEVSLGNSILRTETAGVVACNMINIINKNDF